MGVHETGEAAPPVKLAGPPAPDVVLWSNVAPALLDTAAFCSLFLPFFFGGRVHLVDVECGCGCCGCVLVVAAAIGEFPQGANAGECRAGGSWATCKHRHSYGCLLFGDGVGTAQDM